MALTLREDLFFCLTDRCAIFLDLEANRYFGLTGFAELALRRIVAGDALEPRLERALQPLRDKGLVVEAQPAAALLAPLLPPIDESLDLGGIRPMAATILRALACHGRAAAEMRLLGLKRMIHKRRARKAAQARPRRGAVAMAPIVAAHHRADRLIGGANRCLLRSIALTDHLARHGHFPSLVIGVRTGAFAAHCWVQQDGMVLNDDVDRVRPFTPIMIL